MSQPDRIHHNPAINPPLQPAAPDRPQGPAKTADGKTFGDILRTKVAERVQVPTQPGAAEAPATTLRWSAHATARLKQRGLELNPAQMQRLEHAVDKAQAKGAKDSLVLLDDTAMVVSVKNRTVITALGRDQAKDNVFTNIDSAVIA